MMTNGVSPSDAVVEFVKQIEKKVHPRSIEIGYEPESDGNDPLPGHPCTWYCEVVLSPILKVRKQSRGLDGDVQMLEALAAAAEALGISVSLKYAP